MEKRLEIRVVCEFGTMFNVLHDGVRIGQVKRECLGAGAVRWLDADGPGLLIHTSGEREPMGNQMYIERAIYFRKLHELTFAQRAANEAARWNGEALTYPSEPRWEDEDGAAPAMKATPPAPMPPAACAAAVPQTVGRCPHGAIRRFFAIAKELGFDTRDKDGARAAVCKYFGMGVCSRSNLTHDQWFEAGTAMKKGWLSWGEVVVAGGAR